SGGEAVTAAEAPVIPAAPPATGRPLLVPPVPPAGLPAATTSGPMTAAPARAEAIPEMETGARAQLRVRADTIDRLVNEAGEVAIARARVEGGLRALKANLLERTATGVRLPTQK